MVCSSKDEGLPAASPPHHTATKAGVHRAAGEGVRKTGSSTRLHKPDLKEVPD